MAAELEQALERADRKKNLALARQGPRAAFRAARGDAACALGAPREILIVRAEIFTSSARVPDMRGESVRSKAQAWRTVTTFRDSGQWPPGL